MSITRSSKGARPPLCRRVGCELDFGCELELAVNWKVGCELDWTELDLI